MADPARKFSRPDTARHRSDWELRKYRFRVASPETADGYDRSSPSEDDAFVRVVHDYNIPHKKHSRIGFIWCAFCQRPTHYSGGLALYEDGKVRSVGWACCAKRLDVDLKRGWKDFKRDKVRADRLHQFDTLGPVLADVQREIADLKEHPSVRLHDLARKDFERKMPGLWKWLSGIAFHDDGWIEHEVEFVDYSGTAMQREEGENQDGQTLKGQRTRRRTVRNRLSGWLFVHPNSSAVTFCEEAQQTAKRCVDFYSEACTDDISDREFSQRLGDVRQLVEKLEQLEALSHSLPMFFGRSNREQVAALRNLSLSKPAYFVTHNGIKWRPPDGEIVQLIPPRNYKPAKVRSLGRLKRAMR